MSKISLSPNASGTGTFTIQSPAGDTNRTFTLPDKDGELGVGGGFTYAAVSGATHDLDLDVGNFFDAGDIAADATLTFSNVPTEARWQYSAKLTPSAVADLSVAQFTEDEAFVGSQLTAPWGAAFGDNGTKLYVLSSGTTTDVYQYDLSTAYDATTATYANKTSTLSGYNSSGAAYNLLFNATGTKLWVGGFYQANFYQFNLSTAWDISTAGSSVNTTFNIAPEGNHPYGSTFNSDGTKLYVLSYSPTVVVQYSLSTPYELTTGTYDSKSYDYSSEGTSPKGMAISSDNTKLFVVFDGGTYEDSIVQYSLPTAGDVSTATFELSFPIGLKTTSPGAILFSDNEEELFMVAASTQDRVYKITSTKPSVVTLPSSVSNPPSTTYISNNTVTYDFVTSDGGTTVKIIGDNVT